jgi:hypothetical protein
MRYLTGGHDAKRLFSQGQPARGRITGIRVRNIGGGDNPEWVNEYGLEVEGDTMFACGVRHRFAAEGLVRLGMEVAVLYEGTDAVVDWRSTCGGEVRSSWLLSDVPEPGIDDRFLVPLKRGRKHGSPARATIVGIERHEGILGRRARWEVEVVRDGVEARRATLRHGPPHYATHLGEVGTELPAWVMRWGSPRVIVDWPAAAQERPGVGVPPAEVFAWLDGDLARLMGM